jgi:trans-2-enoyl-CoA reductase
MMNIFNLFSKWLKSFYVKRVSKKKRIIDDWEFNEIKKTNEQKIDKILEKINKKGIESLTDSEMNFLKKMSKK